MAQIQAGSVMVAWAETAGPDSADHPRKGSHAPPIVTPAASHRRARLAAMGFTEHKTAMAIYGNRELNRRIENTVGGGGRQN
jgi:hypothetical protein